MGNSGLATATSPAVAKTYKFVTVREFRKRARLARHDDLLHHPVCTNFYLDRAEGHLVLAMLPEDRFLVSNTLLYPFPTMMVLLKLRDTVKDQKYWDVAKLGLSRQQFDLLLI